MKRCWRLHTNWADPPWSQNSVCSFTLSLTPLGSGELGPSPRNCTGQTPRTGQSTKALKPFRGRVEDTASLKKKNSLICRNQFCSMQPEYTLELPCTDCEHPASAWGCLHAARNMFPLDKLSSWFTGNLIMMRIVYWGTLSTSPNCDLCWVDKEIGSEELSNLPSWVSDGTRLGNEHCLTLKPDVFPPYQGLANTTCRPDSAHHLFYKIRFYWNMAMIIHLLIICGYFHATMAEPSSCNRP